MKISTIMEKLCVYITRLKPNISTFKPQFFFIFQEDFILKKLKSINFVLNFVWARPYWIRQKISEISNSVCWRVAPFSKDSFFVQLTTSYFNAFNLIVNRSITFDDLGLQKFSQKTSIILQNSSSLSQEWSNLKVL